MILELSEKSTFEEFLHYLQQNGIEDRIAFATKIIRTNLIIFGVNAQFVHRTVKECLKYDYRFLTDFGQKQWHDVLLIQGLWVAQNRKLSINQKITLFSEWVQNVDNWALCDSVMSKFTVRKEEKQQLFSYATALIAGEGEFVIRCGVIIMLAHFLKNGDYPAILAELEKIEYGQYYYVDMAVAWLLSVGLVYWKNDTLDFLQNSKKINDFTYLKSLQKARESFRISAEDKIEFLRLFRQKKDTSKSSMNC